MYTCLVVGRGGGGTEGCNAICIQCLATAIYKGVVGVGVGVSTVGWRVGTLITSWVAVAVGICHATGQGCGSLAVRAGSCVAPASVAARVLGHFRAHGNSRQCWVVVGVVAILLYLLSSLVLVVLALLASPPEQDGT